jgi:surfeit locus 1 family protein
MSSPLRTLLRSPRWLAGHALVLVALVLFGSLGLWQLDRLDQRRGYNALLTERMALPEIGSDDLAAGDPEALAYRRVALTGRYLPDAEVLLSARTHNGRPGHHLLTPLRAGDRVVVVDRGWVPLDAGPPPIAAAAPPAGEVRVAGLLLPGVDARRSGALDGGGSGLEFVSDVDLEVIRAGSGLDVADLWVLAAEQVPSQPGALPAPADPPELTEGSHLTYAVQWFLFAAVVAVGYPLLLRRVHRDAAAGGGAPAPEVAASPEPPVPAA